MFVAPMGKSGTQTPAVVEAVTLTGANIVTESSGIASAILIIGVDGTVWAKSTAGWAQISAAQDWIIPNEDADASYEVRYTNFVFTLGDPVDGFNRSFFSFIADEDEWVDLSTFKSFSLFTANDAEPKIVDFDVEIRKDGGAVLATGSYTLSVTRTIQ